MTHRQTVLRHNRVSFHTAAGEDILQRVERHWEKMRGTGDAATRITIPPQPLDQALSHCFVLERVSSTHARFRVAGQALTEVLGQEARNLPLGALFAAEAREALGDMIHAVCDGPEIVEMPLSAPRGLVRPSLRARLLMMPLSDRDGEVTRIFGALVVDGSTGRKPLRFDVDTALPLRRKPVTPLSRHIARMKSQLAALPEPTLQPRVHPAPTEMPTRPVSPTHLRLVVDNT